MRRSLLLLVVFLPLTAGGGVKVAGETRIGKHQEIVLQPDGTRITLIYDEASVIAGIGYPDGSADTLKLP
ncbi:MAG: hypothetical protein AABO58_07790 [Acidobacteriota bacterium]